MLAFKVVGDPSQALLRPADVAGRLARVRLADIRLAWQADGACHGAATFDVEPGEASEVPLTLPSGFRAVQVTVAGVPTTPRPVGDRGSRTEVPARSQESPGLQWRLPLAAEHLPQRIEVLFTGRVSRPRRAGRYRLETPSLGDLPVDRTLWTVIGPPQFEPGRPLDAEPISSLQYEWLRLAGTAERLRAAASIAVGDPGQTLRWYLPWAARMASSRATVWRELAKADDDDTVQTIQRAWAALEQEQTDLATRLGQELPKVEGAGKTA